MDIVQRAVTLHTTSVIGTPIDRRIAIDSLYKLSNNYSTKTAVKNSRRAYM